MLTCRQQPLKRISLVSDGVAHLCPAVSVVGPTMFGSSLKIACRALLLHTLYLEVGGWHRVEEFLASMRALTSDYGTESGLVDMMNVDLTAVPMD